MWDRICVCRSIIQVVVVRRVHGSVNTNRSQLCGGNICNEYHISPSPWASLLASLPYSGLHISFNDSPVMGLSCRDFILSDEESGRFSSRGVAVRYVCNRAITGTNLIVFFPALRTHMVTKPGCVASGDHSRHLVLRRSKKLEPLWVQREEWPAIGTSGS